jgi:small-conductance mechanosensitive channel
MIQKVMRIVLAINLATFVVLLVRLGSPLVGRPALENFIANWWFLSTLAVLILFVLRIVNWRRHKDSSGLWLDAALLATWLCAVGIIVVVGATGFAGF